jgi:ketosteroid isomerase-like protein
MATPVPDELLEAFRYGFECWDRGELDEMMELYAEDAEVDLSPTFLDERPRHGRAEIRAYWDEYFSQWSGFRFEPAEVVGLDDGRFLVDVEVKSRGRRSDAPVDFRPGYVYTFSPEGIERVVVYPSREAALEAFERSRQTPARASGS